MENHRKLTGENLKDFILGAQDGIVNVLGLVLGVAAATFSTKVVLISGLAGLFAESISMGAVAFTSSKAARDYYRSEVLREKREMKEVPEEERREIEQIYGKKGFKGRELEKIVNRITANKKIWLKTMMQEELGLSSEQFKDPLNIGLFVFFSTVMGSIMPLIPFFFMPVKSGIIVSIIICGIALFLIGAEKARLTIGDWRKSGIEMFLVGILAAVFGYVIGALLGILFGQPVTP